jgi:phosphomevalonate kinase
MLDVSARAPGKLFLTGEYAVLCGAPALVAAVDRYAEVTLRLEPGAAGLVVEPAGSDAQVVATALEVALEREPRLAGQRVEARVDSRQFLLSDGRKLGLGRSAATLTAAMAGLLAAGGIGGPPVLDAAVTAHARFQNGRGSGADVAAAVHGGVVEVRRRNGALEVTPRALPPGLELLVGYTGEPAPTEPLLEAFATAVARAPRSLGLLSDAAEQASATIAAGDGPGFTAAFASMGELLTALGRETGLPIVTPALGRLIDAARRAGAVAKPSGAGGGDCGIALARSAAEADRVRAAWEAEGVMPLHLAIAADGVRCEMRREIVGEVSLG